MSAVTGALLHLAELIDGQWWLQPLLISSLSFNLNVSLALDISSQQNDLSCCPPSLCLYLEAILLLDCSEAKTDVWVSFLSTCTSALHPHV